jgi:aminoglycoside phosphotransferase (APT) family kinase protein
VAPSPAGTVCAEMGLTVEADLGGRSSRNWRVTRGGERLVLRQHRNVLELTETAEAEALAWTTRARAAMSAAGWPVAAAVGEPVRSGGSWWTLETWLPGESHPVDPARHAELLARWQQQDGVDIDGLGPQPHRLDHLAPLTDADAWDVVERCEDAEDRRWIARRLEQARGLAEGTDWAASPHRLVHGDMVAHNLLWEGGELTGVVDLELASVDRRVLELLHVWRCRHDDVVHAVDALAPLTEPEWRMLLVDWWSLTVSLCFFDLRRGRRPGQWQLDGRRRTSPLAERLAAR